MELPFPTEVPEFDSDDRISFSKLDNKFIAVHDDGSEFEFDTNLRRWVPAEYDEQVEDDDSSASRKRKTPSQNGTEVSDVSPTNSPAPWNNSSPLLSCSSPQFEDMRMLIFPGSQSEAPKTARPNKKQKAPPQPRQNTAVYVTGLPLDVTIDEVHEVFSRKAGVIAEEIDSGAPRIKLYNDSEGNFKGDALVVFFKPQSVEMAIMLLDDTDFRITSNGTRDGRIRVQVADSSYKKVQHDQAAGEKGNDNVQGDKQRQQKDRDRQKIIKRTQKLDAKLADWDDDDPYPTRTEAPNKRDKTVILRHMFTLQELEEDPAALLEIKEDIREECAKLGTVTSVVLYDEEADGIVSVRFKDPESAQGCIRLMHGRSFDGRVVQASLATGREKFRQSKNTQGEDEEDED